MKKKVLFIVIPIILIIAIVAAVVIGLFLRNREDEKKEDDSTGSKWGDTYYAYLKDATNEDDESTLETKYGFYAGMQGAKVQFCNIENDENPAMVVSYNKDGKNLVNSYYIKEDGNVALKKYGESAELRYVYNVENDSYKWYVRVKTENGWMYYPLDDSGEALQGGVEVSDEKTTVKDENGTELTIAESETKFVEPEITPVKTIDYSLDMKEKDLENQMKEIVKDYQENQELVSEEEKENVTKKVEEVKEKAKKVKEITDKKNSVVGEWVLNSNFKCSDPSIKGLRGIFGSSISDSTDTLTLKEDGTFTFYMGYDYNTSGRYKFEDNKLIFSDLKDVERTDMSALEKELNFEYVEYNNHQFFKFYMENYAGMFDLCLFFEKNTTGSQGIMSDPIPDVELKKSNTSSSNSNASNTSSSAALKVGSCTLKYGKYTGSDFTMGTDHLEPAGTLTFNIKSDGTYTITRGNGETSSGIYEVTSLPDMGSYYKGKSGIQFSEGGIYAVVKDNAFEEMAGAGAEYKYVGN